MKPCFICCPVFLILCLLVLLLSCFSVCLVVLVVVAVLVRLFWRLAGPGIAVAVTRAVGRGTAYVVERAGAPLLVYANDGYRVFEVVAFVA